MSPLYPRAVLGIAMAATFVSSSACSRAASEDASAGPTSVSVHVVKAETLRDVALAPGTVVPSAIADWTIYAPEPAAILEMPKHEGEAVAPGDLLVKFNINTVSEEIAAHELALAEAQARLERAKAEATRLAGLAERGVIPRNSYEAGKTEAVLAETAVSQAQGLLQSVKAQEDHSVVKARFAGTIIKAWHNPGDFVGGGAADPILRVVDPTRLQVSLQLPVLQLARIVPGQAAQVSSFTSGLPEAATVAMKTETNDPTAATGEVRLTFVAPTTLPVDSPLSVEILLDQRTGALVVPAAAVLKDETSSYVMIAGDDGRAHRRDVRRGLAARDVVQISAGLVAGESVIVGGVADVTEDAPITIAPQ